jgi:hypothetical protein
MREYFYQNGSIVMTDDVKISTWTKNVMTVQQKHDVSNIYKMSQKRHLCKWFEYWICVVMCSKNCFMGKVPNIQYNAEPSYTFWHQTSIYSFLQCFPCALCCHRLAISLIGGNKIFQKIKIHSKFYFYDCNT